MHEGKNKGKKWEDQASQDADKLQEELPRG